MLTVALLRSKVHRWYKMFPDDRDVSDEKLAERPSTSTTDENIDKLKKTILANHLITDREGAGD